MERGWTLAYSGGFLRAGESPPDGHRAGTGLLRLDMASVAWLNTGMGGASAFARVVDVGCLKSSIS